MTGQGKPPPEADVRIDPGNDEELERWAARLCTTPAELRKAIAAAGPEVEQVKRQLFLALIRRETAR